MSGKCIPNSDPKLCVRTHHPTCGEGERVQGENEKKYNWGKGNKSPLCVQRRI